MRFRRRRVVRRRRPVGRRRTFRVRRRGMAGRVRPVRIGYRFLCCARSRLILGVCCSDADNAPRAV